MNGRTLNSAIQNPCLEAMVTYCVIFVELLGEPARQPLDGVLVHQSGTCRRAVDLIQPRALLLVRGGPVKPRVALQLLQFLRPPAHPVRLPWAAVSGTAK